MAFVPRSFFQLPTTTPTWFAGHMARSLRQLPELLQDVDFVIEARDSRLPLTSINVAFEEALRESKGKGRSTERLVVYTKRDLAESRWEEPLRQAFREQAGQRVIFTDVRQRADVKKVMKEVVDVARTKDISLDSKVLVVGMPNVGKSSLLNALRHIGVGKGKAFRTGALPGITRKLTGTVKIHEDPSIYVYDTPGVMSSYLGSGPQGVEKALKLGLTQGMKVDEAVEEAAADYLLFMLNRDGKDYIASLGLSSFLPERTNTLDVLLDALARRLGALGPGGIPLQDAARKFLLAQFHSAKFGPWTLDDLSPDVNTAVSNFLSWQESELEARRTGEGSSKTQLRKMEKKRKMDEKKKKWEAKKIRTSSG